jgi:hypothetical protein
LTSHTGSFVASWKELLADVEVALAAARKDA